MNKTALIILVLLIVAGGLYYFMTNMPSVTELAENMAPQNTVVDSSQGRVVFALTDATVDMATISAVNMKVSSVDVHSTAQGWVNASTASRTYNLLFLKANNEIDLLADVGLKPDTYDQVRLTVDSVNVQTTSGTTESAKLPSGVLKINTKLVVVAGETSSVKFDVNASDSLHDTGKGDFIFAPVLKTEVKSKASVNVDTNNIVTITGGHTDDSSSEGMDIDGNIKLNFKLSQSQKLDIKNGTIIKVNGALLGN